MKQNIYTRVRRIGAALRPDPCRRLLSLALCLVLCLGLLPLSPHAGAASGLPDVYDAFFENEPKVSNGTNVTNTYILEVSTGSVAGGGSVENVEYFIIYYTCNVGGRTVRRSEVIFPQLDGISYGMQIASRAGNRLGRENDVRNYFGYTLNTSLSERKALGSVGTDQFLFQTKEPIETVEKIQIFGKKTDKKSVWSCQGMRLWRVDVLYGLDMYGWYSDYGYIDYKGEVIADVVMQRGGGNFSWNSSGGVFTLTGPGKPGAAGITLVDKSTAASFGKENFVGTVHDSQSSNRLLFRLDLSDAANAGLECLAATYEAGSRSTVYALKPCECGALLVRYEDTFGCTRDVTLPLIINALGWTIEKVGNVAIAGFAQQGDIIAVSSMLPDYKSLTRVRFVLGEERATRTAGIKNILGSANRARQIENANKDDIAYDCFAVYRDASVRIEAKTATLHYTFTPGDEEPFRYYTASSVVGTAVDVGTEYTPPLMNYQTGMSLKPATITDRYLITISTDNVVNAGTNAPVSFRVRYINTRDQELTSTEYDLRELIQQFYGEWPGNLDHFAYRYGLRAGGTVQFVLSLNRVKRFEAVSFKVNGDDEWQFKGVKIERIRENGLGPRVAQWQEIDDEGLKSHLFYSRDVLTSGEWFSFGEIYDEEHPPTPVDDPGWTPGNLIQNDAQYHEFDGSSREISAQDDLDWDTLQYYMTYDDTLQDLAFSKKRYTYEVNVKVGGKKVNEDDDDCGSANLFYFQLLFDNGKSGCVLANQQLLGDAFRTESEAIFYIPTTRDYGEVTAIRVIPDDQDGNSDIYDKLQIEKITVSRQSAGSISPTWIADSDSKDGLGWVGIDYRDPGAAGSNRGTEGRTVSEIAHTYQITKTSYKTKLLVSITTGSYSTDLLPDANGNMVAVTDAILEGGMSMSMHYINHEGGVVTKDPVDIIHLMNDYSGLPDVKTRTVEGFTENMDFCVSNPNYQFRPGKTDNFYLDVDNLEELLDMELQIRSSVVTYWNIENVSVYLVRGPGARFINANGEYDYRYPEGQELDFRCCWNRTQSLKKDIQIYRNNDDDSIATVGINFNENSFPISDSEQWKSVVKREPASKDDTINLFIYPSTEGGASDPSSYSLSAEVRYTNTLTHSPLSIATGRLQSGIDASGRPFFYALGLSADYLESIAGVDVRANSVRPIQVPISNGMLQRVRSGVLIDSFYLTGGGNADIGITLYVAPNPGGQSIQRVLLQLDQQTQLQDLIAEEKDLAVALYFTTNDTSSPEMRTKYITLTDRQYKEVRGGEVVEVDFNIDNLREVTGINIVAMGRLEVGIDNAVILQQSTSGQINSKWSFRTSGKVTRTPQRLEPVGTVTVLDLDLTTAADDIAFSSGTNGPVRMTVGYFDRTGNLFTIEYENIRTFVSSGDLWNRENVSAEKCFQSGSTDHFRLLIPDVEQIRWIQLEPYSADDTAGITATWRLQRVDVMTDLSGLKVSRVTNQLILEREPLKISLVDSLLGGVASIIQTADDLGNVAGDYIIPTGGSLDLALNIGEGIRIMPRLEGSTEGVEVVLNRLDPATGGLGRAELTDTRGYTLETLVENANNAELARHPREAAVWRSIVPDDGTWEVEESVDYTNNHRYTDAVVFLPPHNYTDAAIAYRITLTARENPAATIYVNISVPPETNPVPELLAAARAEDEANLAQHEHSIQFVAAVAPTCSNPGNTAYYYCTGCGLYFSDPVGSSEITQQQTVLPATGNHTFGPYVTNNDGTHSKVCSTCGEQETVSCTYQDTVTPPTTTAEGYTTHTCTVCGYLFRDSYTDPIPVETTEPTEPTEPTEDTGGQENAP